MSLTLKYPSTRISRALDLEVLIPNILAEVTGVKPVAR